MFRELVSFFSIIPKGTNNSIFALLPITYRFQDQKWWDITRYLKNLWTTLRPLCTQFDVFHADRIRSHLNYESFRGALDIREIAVQTLVLGHGFKEMV